METPKAKPSLRGLAVTEAAQRMELIRISLRQEYGANYESMIRDRVMTVKAAMRTFQTSNEIKAVMKLTEELAKRGRPISPTTGCLLTAAAVEMIEGTDFLSEVPA